MYVEKVIKEEIKLTGNWINDVEGLIALASNKFDDDKEKAYHYLKTISTSNRYENAVVAEALEFFEHLGIKTNTELFDDMHDLFESIFGGDKQ